MMGMPSWLAFLFFVLVELMSLLIRYDVDLLTDPVTLPPSLSI